MPNNIEDENGDTWYGCDDTIGRTAFMCVLLLAVAIIIGVAVARLGEWPWG